MAGLTSVDGLVSGLDTTSIISKLMDLERQPQTRLKTEKATGEKSLALYQALATKLDTLKTMADAVRVATGWNASTAATSDTSSVVASATAGSQPGGLRLKVTGLAATHGIASASTITNLTDAVVADPGAGTASITVGSTAIDVTADRSLKGVIAAINASSAGITATAVKVDGGYRLQLSAKASGAAATFTASGFDTNVGGFVVTTVGADATIQLGDGPGAYSVSSSSNTFADLTPGLTVTVKARTTDYVTVSVSQDSGAVADKVEALVKAANDVLSFISTNSSYNADTKTAGALLGDPMVRSLAMSIRTAVTGASSGTISAGVAGITSSRQGVLSFDRKVFLSALDKDAAGLAAFFQQPDGIADGSYDVANGANDVSGMLTLAIDNRKNTLRQMATRIDDWDTRLSVRESALRQQFSTMETALGKLKDQSTWLSGQLAGLPSWSSK